jgi:hypothetical protein
MQLVVKRQTPRPRIEISPSEAAAGGLHGDTGRGPHLDAYPAHLHELSGQERCRKDRKTAYQVRHRPLSLPVRHLLLVLPLSQLRIGRSPPATPYGKTQNSYAEPSQDPCDNRVLTLAILGADGAREHDLSPHHARGISHAECLQGTALRSTVCGANSSSLSSLFLRYNPVYILLEINPKRRVTSHPSPSPLLVSVSLYFSPIGEMPKVMNCMLIGLALVKRTQK